MLQLHTIRKAYTTGTFTQNALDDVSIAFRDSEFVAILGPSGSGKTTLLNIVGGLDHYDSGDLVIDGISTKKYKDRDWDSYRNNRIGFVFQSYNLIPHQTVLANVELALTLSGVSRNERHTRALEALEKVGLEEHINKKPSQLSGGQMQRVAIARALINDPEILLADEPTGALDSKTSVQIMDLLTEIAHDRLVIMVTHNPELAKQYATRIVNLADGVIHSDSHPFDPDTEQQPESTTPTRKTSMSFLTALALSFNNLMTKKGRTLMTAFAGSIGIIGIAAILSLANGVNNYIKSVEEDTLSEYPLKIQSTGFDMTALMFGAVNESEPDEPSTATTTTAEDPSQNSDKIRVSTMLTSMLSSVGANDLASLKEFFESGTSGIEPYVKDIEYTYSVTPQIFSANTEKLRQVHPDKSFASVGLGSSASTNSIMSMSMSTDVFFEMPADTSLYENQYDIKAGRWPKQYNECVLVLSSGGSISDFMQYTLGLRDTDELDAMVDQFAAEENVDVPTDIAPYSYDEVVGTTFKLVNASDWYSYDEEFGVWRDKTGDNTYMLDLVEKGEDIKIVGVAQPKPDAGATMLGIGIYYPTSLTAHVIDQAAQSKIVQDQIAHPDINVFTGKPFGDESENTDTFEMGSLFTINNDALQAAFTIDQSMLAVDMSRALNLQGSLTNMPAAPEPSMEDIASSLDIDIPVDQISALMASIMQQYVQYVIDFTSDPANAGKTPLSAQEWLNQPAVQAQISSTLSTIIDRDALESQVSQALQSYVQNTLTLYMTALTTELQSQVVSALQQSMNQMASNMASAMSIDVDKFQEAFEMNMTEDELGELIMAMMTTEDASCDNNLKKLGYADMNKPGGINIYPIDFESKGHIVTILDDYNARMETEGQDDKVITYTDLVGTLMSSVTDIINMISYVLVAFVAISLVVSSIMIGVITYISVLERKKEIGILRSIGASKRDIGRVFNAETIIVGFVAGVLGIGITALMCIPANIIVYENFKVANVASLPWQAALVLIAISVLLTFLAGLIPSRAASRKDPVEALRSE